MSDPFFSIIITTKNRPLLLIEAIKSVVVQSFSDFEIIVIDDGHSLEIKKMVAELNNTKITYLQNKGEERSAARNTGVKYASGQYICFLDDDDLYEKDFLIDFYNYYEKNPSDKSTILRTGYKKFDATQQKIKLGANYNESVHFNPINFCMYNMCTAVSLCFPKKVFNSYLFNQNINVWEDTEFVVRCLKEYHFVQLDTYRYNYRIHQQMGSKNSINLIDQAKLNVDVISNFYTTHPWVNDFVGKNTLSYLRAEKYIQYSVKSKHIKHKLKLFLLSVKNGVYPKLWKYYLLLFTFGNRQ